MEQPKKTVALKQCPLCTSSDFTSFMSVKDYFLTKETFDLVKCTSCDFVFTNPIPALKELHKYYESPDYLSHNVKRFNLTGVVYDFLRNLNLSGKYKLISKFKNKGSVLDIGQGTGEFLHHMQGKGWTVKGIEPNAEARQFAKEKYHLDVEDESEMANLSEHSFDLITMWHVLEHVPNLELQFNEFKRLLNLKGKVVIAVPNFKSYDASFYGKYWAAFDVPRHIWHFSETAISRLAQEHNFKLVKTKPMWFDAFYVALLSEKYKYGKVNYFRAFGVGVLSNLKALKNDQFSSKIYILELKN